MLGFGFGALHIPKGRKNRGLEALRTAWRQISEAPIPEAPHILPLCDEVPIGPSLLWF